MMTETTFESKTFKSISCMNADARPNLTHKALTKRPMRPTGPVLWKPKYWERPLDRLMQWHLHVWWCSWQWWSRRHCVSTHPLHSFQGRPCKSWSWENSTSPEAPTSGFRSPRCTETLKSGGPTPMSSARAGFPMASWVLASFHTCTFPSAWGLANVRARTWQLQSWRWFYLSYCPGSLSPSLQAIATLLHSEWLLNLNLGWISSWEGCIWKNIVSK